MAKKKKKSSSQTSSSTTFMGSLGLQHLTQIFQNERLHMLLGLLLLGISVCMALSFVSFIGTGQSDMSVIEHLRVGEMSNQHGEFQNMCGSLGAYTAYFFVKQ